MGGFLHGRDRRHAARLKLRCAGGQGWPEQGGEEERGSDRLALVDALVGVGQGLADQAAGVFGVTFQGCGACREQRCQEVVFHQQLEGALGLSTEEQLEHFVEQARRGNLAQHGGQAADGRGAVLLDIETQLGGEARGPQHAHRVFLVALLGDADQPHQAIADVMHAVCVVEDALGGRVVIQRIDGEVAALGVVFQAAIDVVAQDAAAFVARCLVAVFLILALRVMGAEGGDFNDLPAELHMGQLEAAADHPGVAEFGADLLRGGVGGHIEVFGAQVQQQVADATAHQVSLVAGLLQALDHHDGVAADLRTSQRMLIATQYFGSAARMLGAAEGGTERLEQLLQHGMHCFAKWSAGREMGARWPRILALGAGDVEEMARGVSKLLGEPKLPPKLVRALFLLFRAWCFCCSTRSSKPVASGNALHTRGNSKRICLDADGAMIIP
ncbi:hypothetical protein D3C76_917440 [compost metagenome]